jgi:phage gp29-like protein
MAILDQYGRPMPPAASLRREVARATLAGVRSAVSESPAAGLTPGRLAAIHRDAAEGEGLSYLELAEDIEERDLHYAAVLGTRKRAVAQLPITVEAASDDAEHQKHQALIEDWVETGVLEEALLDILDAVGKGFSVCEIMWRTDPGEFWPEKLIWRTQRWFTVDRETRDQILLRDLAAIPGVPLAPHKFLVHRHPQKSGLILRSGLARLASWGWMFKAFTMRDWALFVQNYGQPMRVGRYGPDSSEADRETLWTAIANIAGDCAAIIPKSMEVEFITGLDLKDGSDLYERRSDWLDRQISKAVLGQTTTTDAVGGGHAVAKEHRLVQEDIERADARLLSTTITRQLVQAIIAFNFGPQKRYPRLRIGRPDEVPLAEWTEALSKLIPQGLRVEASQVRDRLGLSEPEDGAEVIERAAAAGGQPGAPGVPGATPGPEAASRPGAGGGPGATPPKTDQPDTAASGDPTREALTRLRTLLAAAPASAEHVEQLTEQLAGQAQGTLAALTAQVRAEIDAAVDLPDLADRLTRLQLDPRALAEAMGAAMAVAHLAGRAALLDELRP